MRCPHQWVGIERGTRNSVKQTSPQCSGMGFLALQGQVCLRQTGQPSRDQESAQKEVLFCVQDQVLTASVWWNPGRASGKSVSRGLAFPSLLLLEEVCPCKASSSLDSQGEVYVLLFRFLSFKKEPKCRLHLVRGVSVPALPPASLWSTVAPSLWKRPLFVL